MLYGSTDAVIPALAIKVLPIGLTGIALAGMLSVIMSTNLKLMTQEAVLPDRGGTASITIFLISVTVLVKESLL